MGRSDTRTPRVAAVAVALALALGGCSGTDEPELATGVDPEWYEALDSEVDDAGEIGEMPVLSRGRCPIDAPEIAGEELDDQPDVGVSTLGESGHRLICQWYPPSTDLVVTRFEDAAELELARAAVSELGEDDNGVNVQLTEAITVGEREFFVRRTEFPDNDTHVDYAVWYLDDEGQGMVLLDVSAGDDRDLVETYTAQQAAEDLSALLS